MTRRLPKASLVRRLRRVVVTACLVVIVLTAAALMLAEALILRTRLVTTLEMEARMLTANATAALMFKNPDDSAELLRAFGEDPSNRAAVIFDAAGHPFSAYRSQPDVTLPPLLAAGQHRFTADQLILAVAMHAPGGRRVGTLVVQRSLSILYQRIGLFALVTLGVVLAATAVALALSHSLQRAISEPVLALTTTADRIAHSHNYTVRAEKRGDDEIGRLAEAFNQMLDKIEAAHVENRRLFQQVQAHAVELESRVAQRTAQLRRSYRELEAFSYSVSHDLRAPLRSISGFVEILLDDARDLSPENVQHLRRVLAAAARMNRLIDGLLDFSRVTNRDLRKSSVDMTALAREVVDELRPPQATTAVEIRIEELSPCVGDATLLRQVFVNLVGNALKYSRRRNPAQITIGEERVAETGDLAYVVRDNGTGFDAARATRLFEVFERFHDPREFEGTGVGLATTKRIIERHGGRIWARSQPGEGAEFFFTLPSATVLETGTTPPL